MMKNIEKNNWQVQTADKLTAAYPIDERISDANNKGLAACGVAAIFYVAVRIVYVGMHGSLALPEIVLLFIMVALLGIMKWQSGVVELPLIFGRRLDPEPAARPKRILLYVLNSAVFAACCTAVETIGGLIEHSSLIGGIVQDFVCSIIVFFVIDLLRYEHTIKKYNAQLAALEADENDLS